MKKKFTYIFPGQGAQYIGMGHDFYKSYPTAKRVFEEADDLLERKLSSLIFNGQESELTQTKNSQPAIYITSLAILSVLQELFGEFMPFACAGLSLGEYTALTASQKLSFKHGVPLVQARGLYMHEACEEKKGAMTCILGMDDSEVEACIEALKMPEEISCANFNCPGQVVISGTIRGVEAGTKACLEKGAKKAIPLQVHGAFHSSLMKGAQEKLKPELTRAPIVKTEIKVATNVTGDFVDSPEMLKDILIRQVTSPVRWHRAIRTIDNAGSELFIEIGCGKTLSGMNKRIGVNAPTCNIEKVEDLKKFEEEILK
jgi:[acyl-carrier-protein] S-malonyltransferase